MLKMGKTIKATVSVVIISIATSLPAIFPNFNFLIASFSYAENRLKRGLTGFFKNGERNFEAARENSPALRVMGGLTYFVTRSLPEIKDL